MKFANKFLLVAYSHSKLDGNGMADFFNKFDFRSEQQSTNGIEINQIETSPSLSETKSLISVYCIEK